MPLPTPSACALSPPSVPDMMFPPLPLGLCTCCPSSCFLPANPSLPLRPHGLCAFQSIADAAPCSMVVSRRAFPLDLPLPLGRTCSCALSSWCLCVSSLSPVAEPSRLLSQVMAVGLQCLGSAVCLCLGANFPPFPLVFCFIPRAWFLEFCQILQQRVSFNSNKNSIIKGVQR